MGFLSGWRLWAALGILLLLVAVGWKILDWRAKAQKLDEVRQDAQKIEEQHKADEARMLMDLAAERTRTQQFSDLAQALGLQLATARAVRQQTREEVAALPPDQLERRIQSDLKVRRPEDSTAAFYPEELREIAHAVSEYPLALAELKKMDERLAAVEHKCGSQQKQIEILEQGYTTLKGHYVTLYNSIGVKKRTPKCLWLWKCGTRTLPTPAPEDLEVKSAAPQP